MRYKARVLSGQEREEVNRRLGAMTMRAVRDFYQSVYVLRSEWLPGTERQKHPEACSSVEADLVQVGENLGDGGRMRNSGPAIQRAATG